MTTNFDSVQTLKSRENCDKYSKSVSYKTLVGGTTTIGRGIKQKESSLILRKAKFQAIFKFVLPLASKASSYKQPQNVVYNADGEVFLSRRRTTVKRGEIRKRVPEDKSCKPLSRLEGIKYNRISAFVSMLVLLIRRSLEKFFKKNFRDDRFCFGFAKVPTLAFLLSLNLSTAFAEDCTCNLSADKKTLTISNCAQVLYNSCTNQKTAKNIKIGTGVTSIEIGAFSEASSLTSITIPDSVKSIGSHAFFGASSLKSITIPDSVTSIGDGAFSKSGLTSITIPDSVTSIETGAFSGASSLTSITIPDSVTSIGTAAFNGATGLTSITIPGSVESIGPHAFSYATGLTSITIPDSVTKIEDSAFYNTTGLTSITIPDSVTSIGYRAFSYTGLTSITIPDSVTSIGTEAFQGASRLESIIIPDNIDTKNWVAYAFADLPAGIKNIVCQGDLNKCYEQLAKYFSADDPRCPANVTCSCSNSKYCISPSLVKEANKDQCGGEYTWDETSTPKCRHMTKEECANSAKYYYNNEQCKSMPGSKTKCKNADFLWSGSSCVKSCASGFVEWDNECLSEYPFAKKRWTPAEANEWLHDGNDNFVVITFKK